MKTSESLFFSQAINACLSVAKSLGASDAIAYELAVNATTESFCQVNKQKHVIEGVNLEYLVYEIICRNKGDSSRDIGQKLRAFRDVESDEKMRILKKLTESNKIYSKKEGKSVRYYPIV
ncbi:hypothetical protein [uncultured Agitococcus sp.]|mgnify:FL=1|jgi:hypothetical protein|uniref:hypothetical protein n=1 Tax=uncultured Agitococcus sp. TaxID=1506599 RepID=UPI002621CD62|nr:hypothetical protein [uncultured Agitococcus sp.]